MKYQYYAKDPRETQEYHYPAPASGQGIGRKSDELLGTLNENGEWEEKTSLHPIEKISDEGSREDELIAQIDSDNDEYYTRADEAEVDAETLLPRRNRFRNGKSPSDATPVVEDDLLAVMSSDDPEIENYSGYVLKDGARQEGKPLSENSLEDESILSTAESRKRLTEKKGKDWEDDRFRYPKFYQTKKEKQKTRIDKTTATFDEPVIPEYLDVVLEDETTQGEKEKSPKVKTTIRSNRDRQHGRGRKSTNYIDGKDHPTKSERRDAHVQEHEIVKQYNRAA
ncbi:MAG: hypothetical protein LBD11_07630 [Candidatus Peribacteria bacterium]|jgi:hypothetical protein|nr:hypothetical protein [Candidatus Peribacteria bacterium]